MALCGRSYAQQVRCSGDGAKLIRTRNCPATFLSFQKLSIVRIIVKACDCGHIADLSDVSCADGLRIRVWATLAIHISAKLIHILPTK